MTSIGFSLLDSFNKSLDILLTKGKWGFVERDYYVLSKMFSWEDGNYLSDKELAVEWSLSAERIRQLQHRALKKVRTAARNGNKIAGKIIVAIDNYKTVYKLRSTHEAIVMFWYNEMPELPGALIVRLLAKLYFGTKADVTATIEFLANWKGERKNENKRLIWAKKRKEKYELQLRNDLETNIIWFDNVRRWEKEQFIGKQPKRMIVKHERYNSGKLFSEKCNKDIQYESGVEFRFIKRLEINPSVQYYLEQPVTIQYTKKEIDREYTPDFAVLLENGSCFIAEVKANFRDMLDARVHRRMEALIQFCEMHGMGLLLTNGKCSLEYLIGYPCTPGLEEAFQSRLSERGGRTIFNKEYRDIMAEFGAGTTEFLSLVLKNNWGYYPFPFKLTPHSGYLTFRTKVVEKLYQIKGKREVELWASRNSS